MAHVSLVLNDVQCFLVNKFGKLAVKSLKVTLTDFYSVDALAEAKIQLINDVDSMKWGAFQQRLGTSCKIIGGAGHRSWQAGSGWQIQV